MDYLLGVHGDLLMGFAGPFCMAMHLLLIDVLATKVMKKMRSTVYFKNQNTIT